ncbi:MAG: NAD(P)-dependent oxidoreductase [Pseudomonadota bacterium]
MAEIASLPLFHQIAGKPVLVLGDGAAAEPKRRLVERAGGIVMDDQARAIDEGVRLAFVAFEDAKASEVAAINLRCAGMLVNVVDRPDLCDFTTPSLLDRDPLLIAIGTGGASAGLAKHVRLRLERILPQTLGRLAQALKDARPTLRKAYPDGSDRRRVIDEALREGGALDPLNSASHAKVGEWAAGESASGADGQAGDDEVATYVFDLSSHDPEDLTVRQARLLGEADAVCAQGEISTDILARARADAVRVVCKDEACPLRRVSASGGDPSPAPCPGAKARLEGRNMVVVLRSPTSA